MVEIRSLKKSYGERTVLSIESLHIKKGETVALTGPNGSGKSTLLKLLAGVTAPGEGEFSYEGKMLYLPQSSIAFNMSVMKNLTYSMEKPDEKLCEKVLEELKLTHLKNKNAKSLSGGERQRLAFGRILVNRCDLLLLDEPTSAVDIEGAQIIEKALKKYRKDTGCTVIIATHSPVQAKKIADRIIMLGNGLVQEDLSARDIMINPVSEWGRKFIESWKL